MSLAKWQKNLHELKPSQYSPDDLPCRFSYFDCTDCIDTDCSGKDGVRYLTCAIRGRKNKLTWIRHFLLLLRYLGRKRFGGPDVHAGYFQSPFLRTLINRLAYIGYAATVEAYENDDEGLPLKRQFQRQQIRVLVSPHIRERRDAHGERVAGPPEESHLWSSVRHDLVERKDHALVRRTKVI
jgi:hypothetical protein